MNRILVFILTAVMAGQSLGLSYVALPDMNTSDASTTSQVDGHAMPCHDQALEQVLDEMNTSAHSDMADCCDQADCSCCWGCAGLLNGQLTIAANHPPRMQLLGFKTQLIISPIQSLYRPPIFA